MDSEKYQFVSRTVLGSSVVKSACWANNLLFLNKVGSLSISQKKEMKVFIWALRTPAKEELCFPVRRKFREKLKES